MGWVQNLEKGSFEMSRLFNACLALGVLLAFSPSLTIAGEVAATIESVKGEAKATAEEVKGEAKAQIEEAKGNKVKAMAERAKGNIKAAGERVKGKVNEIKAKTE